MGTLRDVDGWPKSGVGLMDSCCRCRRDPIADLAEAKSKILVKQPHKINVTYNKPHLQIYIMYQRHNPKDHRVPQPPPWPRPSQPPAHLPSAPSSSLPNPSFLPLGIRPASSESKDQLMFIKEEHNDSLHPIHRHSPLLTFPIRPVGPV